MDDSYKSGDQRCRMGRDAGGGNALVSVGQLAYITFIVSFRTP